MIMAGNNEESRAPDTYSSAFAFVYIFNLVIGVGALSLPRAFSDAGFILGSILLVILASMSYVTATFMVEAMATANAYMRHISRTKKNVVEAENNFPPNIQAGRERAYSFEKSRSRSPSSFVHSGEKTPLVDPVMKEDSDSSGDDDDNTGKGLLVSSSRNYIIPADDYEINEKFEMGAIANLFYHPVGIFFYYVVVCLYLYGDLAIYAVAIPKSLVVVVCTKPPENGFYSNDTGKFNANGSCLPFGDINQLQAYYIFLTITVLLLCPWTFFDLTKSKYVQLFTTILRNIAFVLMVTIAIAKLAQGQRGHPSPARIGGFPVLFGVSIYSFMCQHSLPGMITPMKSKKRVFSLIFVDFSLILGFYMLLAYTGAFLFPLEQLNDIYTLNFFSQFSSRLHIGDQILAILGYFLALFPVFTLSTNFPIISITLRENLKSLALILLKPFRGEAGDKSLHWAVDRLVFPLLALIPAIAIAFGTYNVQLLVSITGSFPGIGVQYVIPATLAFAGKYMITKKLGLKYENKYKSPFSYWWVLVVVLLWTVASVALIITEDVINIIHHKFL